MPNLVVSGAYGKDYKSRAAALEAWNNGTDFVIRTAAQSGRYISNRDGINVLIRYDRDRKVTPTN